MSVPWEIISCAFLTAVLTLIWLYLEQGTAYSSNTTALAGQAALLTTMAGAVGRWFADDPALPAWWWAGVHTVPLAVMDLRRHRLPRCWVASFAMGGVCLFAAVAAANHEATRLVRAVLAAVCMWLVMRVVEWACAGQMGGGDTRLHAVLALHTGWVSWNTLVVGFLAGSVLLGLTAGTTCLCRYRSLRSRIAAAPSLLAGAWLALVLAGP